MGMSVNAPLVSFGLPKRAFESEVIDGELEVVTAREQPRRERQHRPAHVFVDRIGLLDMARSQSLELGATLFGRAGIGLHQCPDRFEVTHALADALQLVPNEGRAALDASKQRGQCLSARPPFLSNRLR